MSTTNRPLGSLGPNGKPTYYVRPANHVLTPDEAYAERLKADRAARMVALTAKMDAERAANPAPAFVPVGLASRACLDARRKR